MKLRRPHLLYPLIRDCHRCSVRILVHCTNRWPRLAHILEPTSCAILRLLVKLLLREPYLWVFCARRSACLILLTIYSLLAFSQLPWYSQSWGDFLRVIAFILDEIEQVLRVRRYTEGWELVKTRLTSTILVKARLHLCCGFARFFVRHKLRIIQPFRALHQLFLLPS